MSYQKLIVWQKSMDLAEKVYEITKTYPKEERFGLVSQIRRSVISIPSNIAEGYGRMSSRYFVSFLKISLGSLLELETQIILSERFKYSVVNLVEIKELIIEVRKILIAIIKNNSH